MGSRNGRFSETFSPPNFSGAAIITTAGAVVAQDWPGATSAGLISTSPRYAQFDSQVPFVLNLGSTFASLPTTNSSGTTASSGQNMFRFTGDQETFRIPGNSTGYSVTAPTSGAISISFWHEY